MSQNKTSRWYLNMIIYLSLLDKYFSDGNEFAFINETNVIRSKSLSWTHEEQMTIH